MTVKNSVWAEKALLVTNEVCLTWSLFSTSTCHPSLQKTSCLVPWTGPTRTDGDVRRKKSLCTTIAAYNRVMVAKQEVSTACVCGGEAGTHTTALAPSLRSSFWWVLEGPNLHKGRAPNHRACPCPEPTHHAHAVPLNEQSDFRNQEAFSWLGLSVFWPCALPRCRGEHEVITPSEYEV